MKYAAGACSLSAILIFGWVVLSQHQASDGFWHRTEGGPMAKDECRAMLKRVTTRPKVTMVKWYDVTPQTLEKFFGHPATPDRATWVSCWPEEVDLGEPDS